MTKKGYLTAQEYTAIRKTLGLTQEEARDFHRCQNIRTIQRWEKGDSWVSELACDKITALFNQVNRVIAAAIEQAQKFSKEELEVILIIYPDSCYKKYAYGFENLPNSVHRAMIYRTYTALKEMGIKSGVVEFNPQDYFVFLGQNSLSDCPQSRSLWAVSYHRKLAFKKIS